MQTNEVETERHRQHHIHHARHFGGAQQHQGTSSTCEIFVEVQMVLPKCIESFDKQHQIATMPIWFANFNSSQGSPVWPSAGRDPFAAAAADGKSEIRVWKYDFTSEISPELKKIQAKRVADRNAEEKKQLENHLNSKITELGRFSIDDAAVFSISFGKDHTLLIAAADGKIRRLNSEGNLTNTFNVCDVAKDAKLATSRFDAKDWQARMPARVEESENATKTEQVIEELLINPSQIKLDSPYDYTQIVVTAVLSDQTTQDVTRVAEIKVPDWVTLTDTGIIRPAANGTGSVSVTYGGITSDISIAARGVTPDQADDSNHGAVDFIKDVGPILSRLGCNQGTCHGAQKGKNGFKLSLRGYDPIYDLRALTDDLAARRIDPASPDESLMLRKPSDYHRIKVAC